jgi:hypothetical protein
MQHTKIIIKKLSASLFGKEQGEGSSPTTNGSTTCSDDSSGSGSSDGYQVRRSVRACREWSKQQLATASHIA